MSNQGITLNSVQQALCAKFHLSVEPHGDGFLVTDRDPVLKAKKKGYPKHRGTDLNALIFAAKAESEKRNGTVAVEPEPVVEPAKVVPLRRAVITEADFAAPVTLTDVVLDDSGKKVKKTKVVVVRKHRDNRYARAFRAIIENPTATVAQQAKIADVSEDMLVWYHITFRSLYSIIVEKYGEVFPALPALNK